MLIIIGVASVIYLSFSPLLAQQTDYYNVWKLNNMDTVSKANMVATCEATQAELQTTESNYYSCVHAYGGINLLMIFVMFVLGIGLGALIHYLWSQSHRKSSLELWYEIPEEERMNFAAKRRKRGML